MLTSVTSKDSTKGDLVLGSTGPLAGLLGEAPPLCREVQAQGQQHRGHLQRRKLLSLQLHSGLHGVFVTYARQGPCKPKPLRRMTRTNRAARHCLALRKDDTLRYREVYHCVTHGSRVKSYSCFLWFSFSPYPWGSP